MTTTNETAETGVARLTAQVEILTARSAEAADQLVEAMNDDHDCHSFEVSDEQQTLLAGGVTRMLVAGCAFTEGEILDIATGDQGELDQRFGAFDGWASVSGALNRIFHGDEGDGS